MQPAESLRQAVKARILEDMLGAVQDTTGGGWRVLVLDDFTTRILSSALRMSDILDCNVSVVEDLQKARAPRTRADRAGLPSYRIRRPAASMMCVACSAFTVLRWRHTPT